MFDFILPDLGEGITEGEIRKWLVSEGDSVEEHQTVLEIETDKAVVEVPSPKKGRIIKINKKDGETARVGEVLMVIGEEGEAKLPDLSDARGEKPKNESGEMKHFSVVGVLPEEERAVLAVPAVRARARELNLNLDEIQGTGPGGSITMEDLNKASQKNVKAAEDIYGSVERVPIRGLRKTISKNLVLSQRITAFVTGMEEADITDLWELREREKKALRERGAHLTFMPFIIKAVLHAIGEHPYLNSSVDEEKEEIVLKKYFNIGIAVDTPEGLMVPVVKAPAKKTIHELALELQDLGSRARERRLKIEEMRGGCFTVTNWGHFGGTFATPIINYPESAILGTGRISDKPWVKDGQIVIRKILPLSLTFDHRVTDGVDASKFLKKIVDYLEDPALLFIESA